MKLLIATGLYPPDIGGPATYTVFLEKHAPRFGLELIVLPFTSFRNSPPLIRHLNYFFALLKKTKGCDMIYALDTVSVGVPALLASLVTGKPLLLRVPGDYAWEQGQQRFNVTETLDEYLIHPQKSFAVRFLAWLQYRVASHAMHIIVPSDYMKEVVSGWGINKEKITRIYSVLKTIDVETKDKKPGIFKVTTAARLVPWKGMSTLIDAVVNLRKKEIPIELSIIGDGVCRDELETQVKAQNANEYITFRGALSRTDLGNEVVSSDVFVLNTSYEGLSHQLLEVMSLGVPIVTTPVGGNVELISHEKTGLMVPYNDLEGLEIALQRLHDDPALGKSIQAEALAKVQLFHEEKVIPEFISLIQRLCNFSS